MTSLKEVLEQLKSVIPDDVQPDVINDISLAKSAVNETGALIKLDFDFVELDGEVYVDTELTKQQVVLASKVAHLMYLQKLHDSFNRGAIDFETLTFKVKNLSKRSENIDSLIYKVKKDITSMTAQINDENAEYTVGNVINWGA